MPEFMDMADAFREQENAQLAAYADRVSGGQEEAERNARLARVSSLNLLIEDEDNPDEEDEPECQNCGTLCDEGEWLCEDCETEELED